MGRHRRLLAAAACLVGVPAVVLLSLSAFGMGHLTIRTPVATRSEFDCTSCAAYPPPLAVRGHDLMGPDGSTVTLRGVMVPELERLADAGRLRAALFESIATTGANVVRLPVDPVAWRSDPDYLARYIDPAVRAAGEVGLYAIVDLHMIGNIVTGSGQAMPDVPALPLAEAFWTAVSGYFRAVPHVLFEIVNEPAAISADAWQPVAGELVQAIRRSGAGQPAIVGGITYASDVSWVMATPIADRNVAYAVHLYPGTLGDWQRSFGDVAFRYPVLVTEWGFMDENPSAAQEYLNGSAATFGDPLMAFLARRGIGWVACWWDASWEPPMLRPDGASYTNLGRFVVEQLGGT